MQGTNDTEAATAATAGDRIQQLLQESPPRSNDTYAARPSGMMMDSRSIGTLIADVCRHHEEQRAALERSGDETFRRYLRELDFLQGWRERASQLLVQAGVTERAIEDLCKVIGLPETRPASDVVATIAQRRGLETAPSETAFAFEDLREGCQFVTTFEGGWSRWLVVKIWKDKLAAWCIAHATKPEFDGANFDFGNECMFQRPAAHWKAARSAVVSAPTEGGAS